MHMILKHKEGVLAFSIPEFVTWLFPGRIISTKKKVQEERRISSAQTKPNCRRVQRSDSKRKNLIWTPSLYLSTPQEF